MTVAPTRQSLHRPGWWWRAVRVLRRFTLFGRSARAERMAMNGEPALGPLETRAVDTALARWVRLQKAESKVVPAQRVDSR